MLTASSLIMVKPAFAQTAKSSVPEFTVKFVDHSYDVPTSYSIDPYTGKNVTHASYPVKNITLDVTIKNQPFVPYSEGGWKIEFFYNIRMKGHYSEDWIELYRPSDGYPSQSASEYTMISLGGLGENGLALVTSAKMIDVPFGAQVDFQVEAMVGYVHRVQNPNATNMFDMYPWVFTGETSDWSDTQIITIPDTSTPSPTPTQSQSPAPSLTPSPSIPEFPSWIILSVVAIVTLLAVMAVRSRKGTKILLF